jgi:hypothetical protein
MRTVIGWIAVREEIFPTKVSMVPRSCHRPGAASQASSHSAIAEIASDSEDLRIASLALREGFAGSRASQISKSGIQQDHFRVIFHTLTALPATRRFRRCQTRPP